MKTLVFRLFLAFMVLAFMPFAALAQPSDAPAILDERKPLDRAALAAERPAAPPTMENVLGREGQDLSGTWRYLIDPMRAGLRLGNSRRDFFNDRKEDLRDGMLIEYDWDEQPTIEVPGDWNSQITELRWYEDMVWYRRLFDTPLKRGKRYFLHFEGAGYRTHVFLNGEKLGFHDGGFTPFEFDVTDTLKRGRNSLVVAVDARHGSASIPGDYFDWKNYGGVTRPVHLVEVPQTYIRDYQVALSDDSAAVDIRVALDGPRMANRRVSVVFAGEEVAGRTGADGVAVLSMPLGDKGLWSPEDPKMHIFKVSAGPDSVEDRIGLRDIEVRGAEVLLNGEPVFLRGISIHEEALGEIGSRWMDDGDVRALLGHVKDLNANFIRLAHYPHNERMVRIAEEMGLLVWSEIPVYWEVIDYANPETMALARRIQAASIHRDYNRANVIIWSVANETPITAPRNAFLGVLVDDARALGGDRLISAALNKNKVDGDNITINDPLGADLDLLAVNVYEGWYGPRKLDAIPDVQWFTDYDKPLMFSEFGAGAPYGFRADPDVRWSEDYQAKYYAKTLEMAEAAPNFVGVSPWLLKDFRSPRRWHGKFQDYWNRKGVISETGERKEAFSVLADWFAERAATDQQE